MAMTKTGRQETRQRKKETKQRVLEQKQREKRHAAIKKKAVQEQASVVLRSQREGRARGWFWDRITPSVLHFYLDYAVVGNTYRSFWAIREYAPSTTDQAILKSLAAIPGVTLRIYAKRLTPMEEAKLLQSGGRKSVYQHNAAETLQRAVETQEDLNDMTDLFRQMRKDKELLIYCSVFIECRANTKQELTNLQMNVRAELMAYKLSVDELHLQQREGMLACHPLGSNVFGKNYCRPLPASSVANLYPISFSGRLDPRGLRIGKDRYGSDIYLDLDRRTSDVTNGNVVILGNAGEGKSWLVKLLCTNLIEQGKSLYLLDPEGEYRELIENLGGTYLDFLSGEYKINLLQPKRWEAEETADSAATFRMTAMPLSMHISYLKDFFRVYKEFDVQTLDTLEILLSRFYEEKEIYDENAFALPAEQYPIMEDFYCYVETVYASKEKEQVLYAEEILRRILTALYSMARGAEAVYFNGHTNLPQSRILAFGVQGLLETNKYLKNAVLFHLLSYFSDKLLVQKNAAAVLEEFYLFLTSEVVVEYVRNIMKRDRKQDSLVILASQNIEDYLLPLIKELTKPLLAIPSHQFLFYPGNVIQKEYCDLLQVDEVEYGIIRKPERGRCLYRCGSERYVLLVQAPEHKARLFGAAGGR